MHHSQRYTYSGPSLAFLLHARSQTLGQSALFHSLIKLGGVLLSRLAATVTKCTSSCSNTNTHSNPHVCGHQVSQRSPHRHPLLWPCAHHAPVFSMKQPRLPTTWNKPHALTRNLKGFEVPQSLRCSIIREQVTCPVLRTLINSFRQVCQVWKDPTSPENPNPSTLCRWIFDVVVVDTGSNWSLVMSDSHTESAGSVR